MSDQPSVPEEAEGFASVERSFAKVDGLVVPVRGHRAGGFELYYPGRDEFNTDGMNFTFRIFQQLGAWDRSVLLVLLKLLGQRGKILLPEPEGANLRQVRQQFDAGGEASAQATVLLSGTSYSEILRNMGLGTAGRARRLLRESLQRLSAISLWIKHRSGAEGSSNLLVVHASPTGDLLISIHYLLARAFLSESHWARINLGERWHLNGDIAKILHRWLSAWLDEGETKPARLSTLERHVWGNTATGLDRARRFSDLKAAFREIESIGTGWLVTGTDQRGDCTCRITRPLRSTSVANESVLPALDVQSEMPVAVPLSAIVEAAIG
ncbi:replication protein C, IncQ-type [Paeniroseomonas aquatica]|uniref:replication protein C, IncQ-type n=1 Tax=Paeniroseomonas aquatica TaxID=373043 RepID=UPI003607D468